MSADTPPAVPPTPEVWWSPSEQAAYSHPEDAPDVWARIELSPRRAAAWCEPLPADAVRLVPESDLLAEKREHLRTIDDALLVRQAWDKREREIAVGAVPDTGHPTVALTDEEALTRAAEIIAAMTDPMDSNYQCDGGILWDEWSVPAGLCYDVMSDYAEGEQADEGKRAQFVIAARAMIAAAVSSGDTGTAAATSALDAAHFARQIAFSERTFGPGPRTAAILDHIRKELDEVAENPADLGEWVDVMILAADGAWRAGHQPQAIIDAVIAKQARNETRTWPDWRTAEPGKAIEHDRSGDTAAAPDERAPTRAVMAGAPDPEAVTRLFPSPPRQFMPEELDRDLHRLARDVEQVSQNRDRIHGPGEGINPTIRSWAIRLRAMCTRAEEAPNEPPPAVSGHTPDDVTVEGRQIANELDDLAGYVARSVGVSSGELHDLAARLRALLGVSSSTPTDEER